MLVGLRQTLPHGWNRLDYFENPVSAHERRGGERVRQDEVGRQTRRGRRATVVELADIQVMRLVWRTRPGSRMPRAHPPVGSAFFLKHHLPASLRLPLATFTLTRFRALRAIMRSSLSSSRISSNTRQHSENRAAPLDHFPSTRTNSLFIRWWDQSHSWWQ